MPEGLTGADVVNVTPENPGNNDLGPDCVTLVDLDGPCVPPRLTTCLAALGVTLRVRGGNRWLKRVDGGGRVINGWAMRL